MKKDYGLSDCLLWLPFSALPHLRHKPATILRSSADFDEIKTEENAEQAKQNAGRLLNSKPTEIKIDSPLLRSHQKKLQKSKISKIKIPKQGS